MESDLDVVKGCLSEEIDKRFVTDNWALLRKRLPRLLRKSGAKPEEVRDAVKFYRENPHCLGDVPGTEDWSRLPLTNEFDPHERTSRGTHGDGRFIRQAFQSFEENTSWGMESAWKQRLRQEIRQEKAPKRLAELKARLEQLLKSKEVTRKRKAILRELVVSFTENNLQGAEAKGFVDLLLRLGGVNYRRLTDFINGRRRMKKKPTVTDKTVKKTLAWIREAVASDAKLNVSARTGRKAAMEKSSVLERALDHLEALHTSLGASEVPDSIVEEAGYAFVDLARDATERVFQELYRVEDIAPGAIKDQVWLHDFTFKQAREYLLHSMSEPIEKDTPRERVTIAVAKLAEALEQRDHPFRLAILAKESAMLLLGVQRLGGVYAEWQTSTLGVGLLSWREQERLNQRVLSRVHALNREEARRDAQRFHLPPVKFVEIGCYGNIAKACFRAVAERQLDDIGAEQVAAVGSGALRNIEQEVAINPEQYREYLVATMYAMEAALLESLGKVWVGKDFWQRFEPAQGVALVKDVLRIEPSSLLRELVVRSARSAGIEVAVPALSQDREPLVVVGSGTSGSASSVAPGGVRE